MRITSHAFLMAIVSVSSHLLGVRQPDGWLCTAARIVAFDSTASRIITRMSAHVSVIPPWLIRTDFISR